MVVALNFEPAQTPVICQGKGGYRLSDGDEFAALTSVPPLAFESQVAGASWRERGRSGESVRKEEKREK